jgi:hypothetical protein
MKYTVLFLSLFFLFSCGSEKAKEIPVTYFEASGFTKTPDFTNTLEYCRILDQSSDLIQMTVIGKSYLGKDIPLLMASASGFDPAKSKDKTVILIEACIHAGEPDGKDAGLMLFRDFATNPAWENVLKNITVLFIPVINVDGHERFGPYNRINQNGPDSMGWRTNAQNLNLNRDFINAETPEIQAFIKLFNQWDPDFFIDCHTTDGADYQYAITYGMETAGDMDSALTHWQKEVYLPYIETEMQKAGYLIFPYVMFRNWHDPRSGLLSYASNPMLSQGYTAQRNCPGLLIETHMLKDYKTRVFSTYEMIKNTISLLDGEGKSLKDMRKNAFLFSGDSLALDFDSNGDSTMVDFLGVEYSSEKSDLTQGLWFKYDNTRKATFNLPYFNVLVPSVTASVPDAYVIPAAWKIVAEKLRLHGVKVDEINENTKYKVTRYVFSDVVFRPTPYEGKQRVESFTMKEVIDSVIYPAGSFYVNARQPLLRVIMHMLEPKAPASLLNFGYFNVIFEQKEYTESYVMETMAREMLKKDTVLAAEFKEKMKDPSFASNSYGILNWFYSKSPYWDKNLNVYPVGKLYK